MLDEDLMPPDPPPYPWGSAVGIVIHPDPRISPPGLRPGDRVNIMGMLQTPGTPPRPYRVIRNVEILGVGTGPIVGDSEATSKPESGGPSVAVEVHHDVANSL